MPSDRAFSGIFNRKMRWGLSGPGWLIALLVTLVAGVVVLNTIGVFLAPTAPVQTSTLVVEGWLRPFAINEAARIFRVNSYSEIFTTGGPISGMGGYTNDYNTSASLGAGRLSEAGVPPEKVQMVPSRVSDRDRTFGAAVALREWFRQNGVQTRSFNIITESAHARRTRLLFQKAFGDGYQIGIISVADPDYDAKHWWRSSEGVRDVVDETVAYLYALLVFH